MKNFILKLTQTRFAHGLFLTVGGALSTAIYNAVNTGHLPQTWADIKPILIIGLSAGLVYICKNLTIGTGNVAA